MADTRSKSERTVFHCLDGMRGLAALAVVERHKPDFLFGEALPASYLAVDLFFILSGFVIAFAYEEKLRNGWRLADFFKARVIRLYPLYLAATVFSTVLFAMFFVLQPEGANWRGLLLTLPTALLFLPTPEGLSLDGTRLFPLNDPAWSLFFEIAVNLAFAALILHLTVRRMLWIVALAAVGMVLAVFRFGAADVGFDWVSFWGGFPRVTVGFFIGVLLFRVHQRVRLHATGWNRWFAGWSWPVQLIMLASFALPVTSAWRPHYDLVAAFVVFPVLIFIAAQTKPDRFSQRIFLALGAASYGIYVFHIPAARALKAGVELAGFEVATLTPWIGVGFMTALFVGSWLIELFADRPLRRWLNQRFVRGLPAAEPVPPKPMPLRRPYLVQPASGR